MKGVKSSSYALMVLVPIPFILIFVIMGYYLTLNSSVEGKGIQYYWSQEAVPLPSPGPNGETVFDHSKNFSRIMVDACNMAFYSVGLCVGVFYSYGSYCDLKKPVIRDAFTVVFLDLIFSIVAGFSSWSVIGYLQATDNTAFSQDTTLGLTFVAYPIAG
jgi:SNF family Na+-dependent transporter